MGSSFLLSQLGVKATTAATTISINNTVAQITISSSTATQIGFR